MLEYIHAETARYTFTTCKYEIFNPFNVSFATATAYPESPTPLNQGIYLINHNTKAPYNLKYIP